MVTSPVSFLSSRPPRLPLAVRTNHSIGGRKMDRVKEYVHFLKMCEVFGHKAYRKRACKALNEESIKYAAARWCSDFLFSKNLVRHVYDY